MEQNSDESASNVLASFASILRANSPQVVSKGTIIYYQGEAPRAGCFIKSGVVKVYNLSADGEEQLINFHTANDFLPTPWLFGYATGSIYFYEAFTDCELVKVPKDAFMDLLSKSKTASHTILGQYIKNYIGSMMRITALEQPKAAAKIMYTFYFLTQRFGRPLANGMVRIGLQLTHQQFAHLVGLTRETTATEIKRLQKANIISYKTQTYAVDVDKLLKQMGEEEFGDITIE